MSIAGVETCIEVPSWKLCFDIGKCPDSATRWGTVLFTHGHADHIGGVVHHVGTREMRKQKAPRYLLPKEYAANFDRLMDAWRALDHAALECEVVPVAPGDRIDLGKGRSAHVFRSVHRVPTCGYAIEESRRHLKPEWVGRGDEAIRAARAAGIAVHDDDPSVELVFCGDTTIHVVEREAIVRKARRLILEATFLDDRVSRDWARRSGHVHLEDIVERADLFENEAILLTHFSQRYSPREIREIVAKRLPASLKGRVQVLTDAS
ncbi:MAG: hypothetical protein H6806_00040 [Planctomycetes bacterium]|nr:hypothetical protein [Alphaproteobacteria bacterium]MCB9828134.1 hypothetical protein [Planctomycetota bacterium]